MIYNKKITKDIVTSMTMLRNNGKSVEASARETARALSKKYGAKFKWTGVRGKFYEVNPTRSKTKSMPKTNSMSTTNTTSKSLRAALASMATDSNSVTIQVTGNMVTVVYK
tara:strand:- start:251 stop:583 length:333 start_codon:yes stop_codon:yes gene_type:complete